MRRSSSLSAAGRLITTAAGGSLTGGVSTALVRVIALSLLVGGDLMGVSP